MSEETIKQIRSNINDEFDHLIEEELNKSKNEIIANSYKISAFKDISLYLISELEKGNVPESCVGVFDMIISIYEMSDMYYENMTFEEIANNVEDFFEELQESDDEIEYE